MKRQKNVAQGGTNYRKTAHGGARPDLSGYDQKKRQDLAQNFLKNPAQVRYLIKKSDINPGDQVLEIGPGRGIITAGLLDAGAKVIAIEKDPVLASALKDKTAARGNTGVDSTSPGGSLKIITGSALDINPARIGLESGYKIFSNPPFNITSALVKGFCLRPPFPQSAYLVMQKQAAMRFMGQARNNRRRSPKNRADSRRTAAEQTNPPIKHNLVSMQIDILYEASIFYHFKTTDFSPAPRSPVVMIRLDLRSDLPENIERTWATTQRLLTHGYSEPILPLIEKLSQKQNGHRLISEKQLLSLRKTTGLNPRQINPLQLSRSDWLVLGESASQGPRYI